MLAHQGTHFFSKPNFTIPEDFTGYFFSNFGVPGRTDFTIFDHGTLGLSHIVQQSRVEQQSLLPRCRRWVEV
jgi:hypothetical protein